MIGLRNYDNLRAVLQREQPLGGNRRFIDWDDNGGLIYELGSGKQKVIPAEIIQVAYYIIATNDRRKERRTLNSAWLYLCGHDNPCSSGVLKYITRTYLIR